MANNTFTNTAGGPWSTAGNWSAGLPDNNAQVSFESGTYTSQVDGGPWTIQSLNVNVATVTLEIDADLTAQTLEGNLGSIDVGSGATFTLGSLNSSSGAITVSDGGVFTVQNLNGNNGDIVAGPNGLVNLEGNGAGNFTVSGGVLKIAGNFNGSGVITMNAGTMWLAGQLGGSSYNLDDGAADKTFFDSLQATTTNSFSGADVGDRLEIKGVTITSLNYVGTTLTVNTSGGTFAFTNITLAPEAVGNHAVLGTETFEGNSYGYVELACYARGTPIRTPSGEIPIEALAIGDMVTTLSGEAKPIRWIGRRSYGARFIAGNRNALPIRFVANALADGVPSRDLDVSPKHAMLIDGVLVPAEKLVNGASIHRLEAVENVEYLHLELAAHDVVFAAGAASETFTDCDNRFMFQNAAEYSELYPDAVATTWAFCAPRIEDGEVLEATRRRLEGRMELLGYGTTFDPALRLVVDDREVAADEIEGDIYRFRLTWQPSEMHLVSRSSVPAEGCTGSADRRRLGVNVARLLLSSEHAALDVGHGHPLLVDGFHRSERTHRWTDGNARIPSVFFASFPQGLTIEVQLRDRTLPYRCEAPVYSDGAGAFAGSAIVAL